jgi:hypothetical protein
MDAEEVIIKEKKGRAWLLWLTSSWTGHGSDRSYWRRGRATEQHVVVERRGGDRGEGVEVGVAGTLDEAVTAASSRW